MQSARYPLNCVAVRASDAKSFRRREMPVIDFLHSGVDGHRSFRVLARLNQVSFAEHRNVAIEYRWADAHDERFPTLAAGLVQHGAAVIIAGGANSIAAAKRATEMIPIVFVSASDPPRSGFFADVSRPGGNITGIDLASPELLAERLRRLVPSLTSVTALVN